MTAQAMSAGTAETRSGSGRQPASAVGPADAPNPLYQEGYSMTDTTDQQAVTVALSKQLEVATDIGACFCIGCGQPDKPELHDPARCPAREGGELDVLTVADALKVFDTSCDEEPDLDGDPRALHCAIVAARLASVSSASADYVLVPREPTEAMLHAYQDCPYEGGEDKWAAMLAASPEPVPATNQAGEVDVWAALDDRATVACDAECNGDLGLHDAGCQRATALLNARTALATQPATSQEGERDARLAHAKAWLCKRWSQEHPNAQHIIQLADYAEALAATPTPPTLSEDLRGAIARIVCEIVVQITCAENATEPSIQAQVDQSWQYWTDTADRILALAQVKAS